MANAKLGSKAVGSIIKIKESGSPVEFIVCKHDYESELNGSGRTLVVRKDCYDNRQWHSSNVNAYATSDIDAWFNSTYKNLLDADIRGAIGTTKFKYTPGNGNNTVSTLERAIFSLSATELNKSESWFNVEGTALEIASSLQIAYMNGSAVVQWTRSPNTDGNGYAVCLYANGTVNDTLCRYAYGARPSFTLPSNVLVDDSGNVVIPNLTAHKTLINGTVYTVQSGKCMVGGTVYNILKGRTLIGGTGYDVALPTPMPKKGDLIQMNLDGTSRQYRVLRMDGSIAEVLTMWNLSTSIKFNSTNTYSGSILDKYLNTTWYNTLSSDAKAAIVPKNITQDSWHRGTTGSPQYSGTYGNTAPGSTSYTISNGSDNYAAIGSRYVYAISIQEILDYLSDNSVLVDTSGMLRNQNIWKMFWNQATNISEFLWLRSASADDYILAWYVNGYFGYPGDDRAFNENAVRGALQIDLSKIDFTMT